MSLLKQSKVLPAWLGAVLVQVQNSFFYVGLFNTVMLAITLWYTAGYEIAAQYAPWVSLWLFIALGIVFWLALIGLDYKFFYPIRQRFLNEQACKHPNPAMDSLNRLEQGMAEIKKELGLEVGE